MLVKCSRALSYDPKAVDIAKPLMMFRNHAYETGRRRRFLCGVAQPNGSFPIFMFTFKTWMADKPLPQHPRVLSRVIE